MSKISIIGDKESVLGFMAVGFSVMIADDATTAAKHLRRAASEGHAAVYITEDCAEAIPEEIARYKDMPTPAVIVIPGKNGSRGIGMNNIRKSVERAVGTDILFKENS